MFHFLWLIHTSGLLFCFWSFVALFVHLVMLPYNLISPTSPNAKELNLQQNSSNLNREYVKAVVGESLTGNMRWEPRLKWITNDKFIIKLIRDNSLLNTQSFYLVHIHALISLYQIYTGRCTHILFKHHFINTIHHSSIHQCKQYLVLQLFCTLTEVNLLFCEITVVKLLNNL